MARTDDGLPWTGNTADTHTTNAWADLPGWPMRLASDESLIRIVSVTDSHPPVYVDSEGNLYSVDNQSRLHPIPNP